MAATLLTVSNDALFSIIQKMDVRSIMRLSLVQKSRLWTWYVGNKNVIYRFLLVRDYRLVIGPIQPNLFETTYIGLAHGHSVFTLTGKQTQIEGLNNIAKIAGETKT